MQSLAATGALLVVPFMLHSPSENKMIVAQCVCTLLGCGGEAAGSRREEDFDLTCFSRAINNSGGINIPCVYCEPVANQN